MKVMIIIETMCQVLFTEVLSCRGYKTLCNCHLINFKTKSEARGLDFLLPSILQSSLIYNNDCTWPSEK